MLCGDSAAWGPESSSRALPSGRRVRAAGQGAHARPCASGSAAAGRRGLYRAAPYHTLPLTYLYAPVCPYAKQVALPALKMVATSG